MHTSFSYTDAICASCARETVEVPFNSSPSTSSMQRDAKLCSSFNPKL